jgi:ubiquinone/menaquinone biosynthesis C-methylase UbiE
MRHRSELRANRGGDRSRRPDLGVDLTDAMVAQAQDRIETHGWSNISLVQADAADFNFPTGVDAILST